MTVLIQGAEESEISLFLENPHVEETHDGYRFFLFSLGSTRVVISFTGTGPLNAKKATLAGIEAYHPDIIINQGTAGSHVLQYDVGDILIGESVVAIPEKEVYYPSKDLLAFVLSLKDDAPLHKARLGSGDIFTKDPLEIKRMRGVYQEDSEDQESAAMLSVAKDYDVSTLCLRIISNNELTGTRYEDNCVKVGRDLQKFVLFILRAFLRV